MYGEDTQKALWNFDGAELFLIFGIKQKIVEAFEEWDLESAYWKLRLLRIELDAKLQRGHKKLILEVEKRQNKKPTKTEKQIVDEKLKELDNKYTTYKNLTDPTDDETSSFFQELQEFYMHLCYLMKKHGLYFREGEDMRLAVLRR
ncbi:MAG TPA: hypothetical protein VMZ91_14715 [Candidatus Paceibacterota bacterium]|nr:hypothetical protein [Candidatus Paceibacterota bacterium]